MLTMGIDPRTLPKNAQDAIAAQRSERKAPPYIPATEKSKPGGRRKYKNVKVESTIIGRVFDSQFERRVAERLWAREQNGEISGLTFQVNVTLLGCIRMRPDFQYVEDGVLITHEAKGFETSDYVVKRKLWAVAGPTEYRISYEAKTDVIIRPKPTDEMLRLAVSRLFRDHGPNATLDELHAKLAGEAP